MMKCFAVMVLCASAAVPASAGCISHDPGKSGLVLTHHNPYISTTYQQTSEGLVETRITKIAQVSKTVVAVYSHPLLIEKRTTGDEVLALTYLQDHTDLDELPEIRYWSSDVDLLVAGKKQAHGKVELTYEGSEALSIGKCRYAVWKVSDKLSLAGKQPILFTRYYSPDLGIVLRATWKSPDGRVLMNTTYDELAPLDR